MKEQKQEQISIIDQMKIISQKDSLDHFIPILELGRMAYLDVFKEFELSKFIEFYKMKNAKMAIIKEWVKQEDIDLKWIKLEKALDKGILDIPDISDLMNSFQLISSRLQGAPYASSLRDDLSLLYSEELKKFVRSHEQDVALYKRVEEENTYTTQNDEELAHLNKLKEFALQWQELCKIHHNQYFSLRNETSGLNTLFSISDDGEVKLKPKALMDFRRYSEKNN